MSVLDDQSIQAALRRAWDESEPGTMRAHEEGGFVLRRPQGRLEVDRWPRGAQNEILVPPHAGGCRYGLTIVATFHTHPNFGPVFEQQPSLTDVRAVRDDPDLIGPDYEGEYVISSENVYRVTRSGDIEVVGSTSSILCIPSGEAT